MTDIFFLLPVQGATVTDNFQDHISRTNYRGYGGIDFAAPEGTPVVAAATGQVVWSLFETTGYGEAIKLRHDGNFCTVYAHLSRRDVNPAEQVTAGQVIGLVGSTGNSTGPHLHFELRIGNEAVDPAPYFVATLPAIPPPTPIPIGKHRYAQVLVSGLNVRLDPSTESLNIGFLPQGLIVRVEGEIASGSDTWLRLGDSLYAAMRYRGQQFMEWV